MTVPQFSIGFDGANSRLDWGAADATYMVGGNADGLTMIQLEDSLYWGKYEDSTFVSGIQIGESQYAAIKASTAYFDSAYPWIAIPTIDEGADWDEDAEQESGSFNGVFARVVENLEKDQWGP